MVGVMNCALVFIIDANCSPTAVWGVAYALGVDCAMRQAQADIADRLGVVRAAISKETKRFQHIVKLPPGLSQKSAKACASYARTRDSQLE